MAHKVDPSDLAAWARRPRPSAPPPPAAPPAQPLPSLPRPPDGFGYVQSAVGWALVPIDPPIPMQPSGVRQPLVVPAPPGYEPQPAAAGGGYPSNIIPIRRGGMLKPAFDRKAGRTVDPYQDFLAGQRTITPAEAPHLWQGLVPNLQEVQHLSELAPTAGVWRGKGDGAMFDDPVEDANGGRRSARAPGSASRAPEDEGTDE